MSSLNLLNMDGENVEQITKHDVATYYGSFVWAIRIAHRKIYPECRADFLFFSKKSNAESQRLIKQKCKRFLRKTNNQQ
ncbi:unnamed protein product [Paramecium octaurelia]|uniref:Uncharacterized protein n=1 Tax=Paramecium octaurelia TaxID=43137 RepID=A0A8S1VYK9_PAROT|nr:unnamed protein product [Paramecium octaurelia]